MKRIITIIFSFLVFVMIISIDNAVYAVDLRKKAIDGEIPKENKSQTQQQQQQKTQLNLDTVIKGANSFLENADKEIAQVDPGQLQEASKRVFNTLFTIGTVLTVIVGGALGIKFMMAAAEDKAKIKESMMPYIVGCIVIYGAFAIWRITLALLEAI